MKNIRHGRCPAGWIEQYAHLAPAGSDVLDLACGNGRNARLFLRRGHAITVVDRDLGGVADLAAHNDATLLQADLENAPWPLSGRQFGAVIVCNYLHRPILPCILNCVATGGLLLYDTFAVGNERLGRPRNPAFLLRPNELLEAVRGRFTVCAYRHGEVQQPRPAYRQSLCAKRLPPAAERPAASAC